eukprot:1813701-Pleurochrysis_carterae.AAC.1
MRLRRDENCVSFRFKKWNVNHEVGRRRYVAAEKTPKPSRMEYCIRGMGEQTVVKLIRACMAAETLLPQWIGNNRFKASPAIHNVFGGYGYGMRLGVGQDDEGRADTNGAQVPLCAQRR